MGWRTTVSGARISQCPPTLAPLSGRGIRHCTKISGLRWDSLRNHGGTRSDLIFSTFVPDLSLGRVAVTWFTVSLVCSVGWVTLYHSNSMERRPSTWPCLSIAESRTRYYTPHLTGVAVGVPGVVESHQQPHPVPVHRKLRLIGIILNDFEKSFWNKHEKQILDLIFFV